MAFFPIIDTDHFTLKENNFSLSQFIQMFIKMFASQNIPLHTFNPLKLSGYKRSYTLKQTCS